MYTADNVMNITNWYAFAVAVMVPGIISADTAMRRYFEGPAGKFKVDGKTRWQQIDELRQAGATWPEIAVSLGYASGDSAASAYTHGKKRYKR